MKRIGKVQLNNDLSTDINVITAEINAYQRVAGEAIFEIGKRLKHVKENDLAHGEWGRWLTESAKMSSGQARKFITVADEFGENRSTWNDLGLQALYLIATMSEEQREQHHTLVSGETKTVDEMTVRELREVKAELKKPQELAQQAEQRAIDAKRSEEILTRQNERLTDELSSVKKPETVVVEKEVEKVVTIDNTDHTSLERMKQYEERFGALENYSDRLRGTNLSDVTTSVMTFSKAVRELAKRHAYLVQYQDTIGALDVITKQEFDEAVEALRGFTDLFTHSQPRVAKVIDAVIIEVTN